MYVDEANEEEQEVHEEKEEQEEAATASTAIDDEVKEGRYGIATVARYTLLLDP